MTKPNKPYKFLLLSNFKPIKYPRDDKKNSIMDQVSSASDKQDNVMESDIEEEFLQQEEVEEAFDAEGIPPEGSSSILTVDEDELLDDSIQGFFEHHGIVSYLTYRAGIQRGTASH